MGGEYYWLINTLHNFSIYKELKANLAIKDNRLLKVLKKFKNREKFRLLNRINHFSPVLEEDCLLLKKNYKNFRPTYLTCNYGNLEVHYQSDLPINGHSILLGSSDTATTSHYDVLQIVDKLNLSNKKIFIPLSYGEKVYKERLRNYILKERYNQNKITLHYWKIILALKEYNQILSQCHNVFMGHIRQQASGIIISLIYMGSKLCFFREGIVYQYFINKGLIVYSFDSIIRK